MPKALTLAGCVVCFGGIRYSSMKLAPITRKLFPCIPESVYYSYHDAEVVLVEMSVQQAGATPCTPRARQTCDGMQQAACIP